MFGEPGMREVPPAARSERAETGVPEPVSGAETAKIEADRERRVAELRKYLVDYLEIGPDKDPSGIRFESAGALAGEYADQFDFLADRRLAAVEIAVVPDQLWIKGRQPSESHAARGLILMREGFYWDPAKPVQDEPAWMTHELAHCQQFLDKREDYEKDSQRPAFPGIGLDAYPNNKVEEYTFGRQFEYLRSRDVSRGRVAEMLQEQYDRSDFAFFDRILDRVYGRT